MFICANSSGVEVMLGAGITDGYLCDKPLVAQAVFIDIGVLPYLYIHHITTAPLNEEFMEASGPQLAIQDMARFSRRAFTGWFDPYNRSPPCFTSQGNAFNHILILSI